MTLSVMLIEKAGLGTECLMFKETKNMHQGGGRRCGDNRQRGITSPGGGVLEDGEKSFQDGQVQMH